MLERAWNKPWKRRAIGVFAVVGAISAPTLGKKYDTSINVDACLGRCFTIGVGDEKAYKSAYKEPVVNALGYMAGGSKQELTFAWPRLTVNHDASQSTIEINVENKKSKASGDSSSPIALPNFKELGYSPQSK